MSKKARKLGKEMFPDQTYRRVVDEIVAMVERQVSKKNTPLINPTLVATTIVENYQMALSAIELSEQVEKDLAGELVRCSREFAAARVLAFYFVVNGLVQKQVGENEFSDKQLPCILINSMTIDRRSNMTVLLIHEEEEGIRLERLADGRSNAPNLMKLVLNAYTQERARHVQGVRLN